MRTTARNVALKLAILSVGLVLAATVAGAQEYHGGSLEAKQHGYEHGYRDGYQYGMDQRSHSASLNMKDIDADHGYQNYYGPKDEYKDGYRSGYQAGAADGFAG